MKNSTSFHAELCSSEVHYAVETSSLNGLDIAVSTEIQWKGTLYRKGLFLCISSDVAKEFGQIELMLIKEGKHVFFLVTSHDALYSSEFGLYEVLSVRKAMLCLDADLCLAYYPLPAYSFCGKRVISLKHSVLDRE